MIQPMNGDHAEYEMMFGVEQEWPLPSFDAVDWAKAFCQRWPGVEQDVMIAWFANALARGYDEADARWLAAAKKTQERNAGTVPVHASILYFWLMPASLSGCIQIGTWLADLIEWLHF